MFEEQLKDVFLTSNSAFITNMKLRLQNLQNQNENLIDIKEKYEELLEKGDKIKEEANRVRETSKIDKVNIEEVKFNKVTCLLDLKNPKNSNSKMLNEDFNGYEGNFSDFVNGYVEKKK